MGALVQELFRVGFYKRSQGRVARQATFGALAIIVALGAWRLYELRMHESWDSHVNAHYSVAGEAAVPGATGEGQAAAQEAQPESTSVAPIWTKAVRYTLLPLPLVVLLAGLWASFRLVQMPAFADFLISVEGEMSKVSWPARGELFRATVVVILVIFLMALVLFMFDIMWENLRKLLF